MEIAKYLDRQDERKACVEFLKEKFMMLAFIECDILNTYPSFFQNREEELRKIAKERYSRAKDLYVFLFDEEEWDLEFKDYPININDIK